MIGKQFDRSMTQIKSWDMIFIDDEFLNMGDIDRSLELHKIVGQKECTLSDIVENDEKILKLLKIMRMTCLQSRSLLFNQPQQL